MKDLLFILALRRFFAYAQNDKMIAILYSGTPSECMNGYTEQSISKKYFAKHLQNPPKTISFAENIPMETIYAR